MASRFWVGNGAATWTTSGASSGWATTSGGTAGASAPIASDDAFLDTHAVNCTISAAAVCRSLNCTGCPSTATLALNNSLTIGDSGAPAGGIALLLNSTMGFTT